MNTIGVLTSGGDAPGMNACIRAIVRSAIYNDIRVLGIKRGYNGLIHGELEEMDVSSVGDIVHRGGTILRTARCEEFKTDSGQEKAVNVIKVFGIDGIVVIGGDGSFRGAHALSKRGIPTVGIPATIDNDIPCTDYTIGFFTALDTVLDAINKIRDTITSHERANIVEVMGRDCGDIALYAGVTGGAEHIILPEKPFDVDEVCKRLIEGKNRGKLSHIIVVAEGVGNTIEFGKQIEAKTGIETRATILGHIQRGGAPSSFDRMLSSKMGYHSVKLLNQGIGNRVISIRDNKIVDDDITEALSMEPNFDQELFELSKILSI